MAKTVIASPVVALGLDSSGFKSGMAKAIPDAKSVGSKIAQTLKSTLGSPTSFMAAAAGAAVPINAALSIASMAAGAARSILTAPVNALMGREEFLAQQATGMGVDKGADAGWTGTLARLAASWEDTLADMMVALDKAFDFRGWIEYIRGMMAGFSALAQAILGPLQSVQKDPEALTRQFKAGALFTVNTFETIGKISVSIANVFIDVFNWLKTVAESLFAKNENIAGGGSFSAEQEALIAKEMAKMGITRAETIQGLRTVGLLPKPEAAPAAIARLDPARILGVAADARNAIDKMNFAPPQLDAAFAKEVSGKLIPIMQSLQSVRLGSMITSDSTAIVEAVTRASVAGPGQDLQQRVALAAEENVRQQRLTVDLQAKILAAYRQAGGNPKDI